MKARPSAGRVLFGLDIDERPFAGTSSPKFCLGEQEQSDQNNMGNRLFFGAFTHDPSDNECDQADGAGPHGAEQAQGHPEGEAQGQSGEHTHEPLVRRNLSFRHGVHEAEHHAPEKTAFACGGTDERHGADDTDHAVLEGLSHIEYAIKQQCGSASLQQQHRGISALELDVGDNVVETLLDVGKGILFIEQRHNHDVDEGRHHDFP